MTESKLESAKSIENDGEEQPKVDVFNLYLIRPEQVDTVWESKTPNEAVQKLLLEHIEEYGEQVGQDLRSWDENESRYEANELKWISDYVVANLVFIKKQLKVTDNVAISHLLHVLWSTLDLFSENTDVDGGLQSRYEKLRTGLE